MTKRVLIIGLDGADWRILQPYLNEGVMPNLAQLVETGVSGSLHSTIPTNSQVAWSTFMTGRNPGKHGVYDFLQRSPKDPALLVGVNSKTRHTDTFFDTLGKYGRQVGAINVPVTYPPFPVNGFMLGGMFVQEGKPYTYPQSLASELDERVGGFPVNAIRWRFMLGKLEELLDEAIAVTQQRARVLEYLIDHKDWDVLVQVFVSPDRLQHPLMHVLDPEHHCYDSNLANQLTPKIHSVFQILDNMLGRSLEQIGNDSTLIIISDHGFRGVHKAIQATDVLKKHGLLKKATENRLSVTRQARNWLKQILPQKAKRALRGVVSSDHEVGSPHEMANLVWSQTQAYVTTFTSQGIYINLLGREPEGIVSPGVTYEQLLDNIQELLLAERDSVNGQPIIDRVIRAKDFYSGPLAHLAPDLLFVPASGYASAPGAKAHLAPYDWFTGDHDLEGIFVASGPDLKHGKKIEGAGLIDIAPTVLYLVDVPIPDDMDGRVLDLFADDQRLTIMPPKYEKGSVSSSTGNDHVYTPEEERQVEEQLRSLGYL